MTFEEHKKNIGKKFGRLLVIDVIKEDMFIFYICQCECGKTKRYLSGNVTSGKTSSCGCLRNERVTAANYKGNKFIYLDDYAVGYTSNGIEFYVDKEDVEKIKKHTWSTTSTGYIRSNINGNSSMRLHRFILGLDENDKRVVDHINHNTKDNRKKNLRICEQIKNTWNATPCKTNLVGVRGVNFDKRYNKWIAYITKNGKRTYLGSFKDVNDAINARLKAEIEYFGEYSYNLSVKGEVV